VNRVATLLMLFLPLMALSQQKIIEIRLQGLNRTQEGYIRQFIVSQPGDIYDSSKVNADRQRIANLEIMGAVTVENSATEEGIILYFHCTEMISTIPIFALGKSRETFWCRAGVQDANLGGKGDKLIAYYQYYDRHSVFIRYQKTRFKNTPWSFSGTAIRWATIEPTTINQTVVNYNYDNVTSGLSATRHLGFTESIELDFSGFEENYSKLLDSEQNTAPQGVSRSGVVLKSIFRSNRINFSSFNLDGFSMQVNAELIKRTSDPSPFFIIFSDIKYFHRLTRNGNLATRLRLGLSTNEDTPFAPFVLDSYLNIRGVGNRVDRGTGSIVTNLEYRHTIFDDRMFAAQAVGFIDFGTWRKPGGDFSDFSKTENMKAFGGLGLRVIYKRAFDTMLRIDYGYDYNRSGGFVVGIGQYF
jgi:outer membrane protein insertion porin family